MTDDLPALFDPAMLADPYPVYQRLREADPVHWHAPFGAWILTRYADVAAAFHDPRLSAERAEPLRQLAGQAKLDPFFDYLACRMDFKDTPAHQRLRGLVSRAFTSHVVETLRPHVRALVDQLLDAVEGQGRMEVIRDLAFPLPGMVIGELLGVPGEDRGRLKAWSDTFVGFFKTVPSATTVEDYERSFDAARELGDYFRRAVDAGSGGLLRALAEAEINGDKLSTVELSANATLLLHAGHETTTNLIGNGLLALLRHPDQWQLLRADPSRVPGAVEEFLRYDSPVQFTYRRAAEDFTLEDKPIRRDQVVHMLLAAANRDPKQFAEPDRLDVTRAPNRHLSFGHGQHFCLGAPLARLEAEVVFEALLRRYPLLQLEEETPRWRENFVLRGLQALPVRWR